MPNILAHLAASAGSLALSLLLLIACQNYSAAQTKTTSQVRLDPLLEQQQKALTLYTDSKYQEALTLLIGNAEATKVKFGENSESYAWVLAFIGNVHVALHNKEAESYYRRALVIREKLLGPDHTDVARIFADLGTLYTRNARYAEAEQFIKRALAIREKKLGADNVDVAQSLTDLAEVYERTGRSADSERIQTQALRVREKALGPNHPDVAESLTSLAGLYTGLARFKEAESFSKRALAIWEKASVPNQRAVGSSLLQLAAGYLHSYRYREAEPLFKRVLVMWENVYGPEHPHVASVVNSLALVYYRLGKYAEAEPLHKRALSIREKAFGPDHPEVSESLNNLGVLYFNTGKYAQGAELHKRALASNEKTLGADHTTVAMNLNNLGGTYERLNRNVEAEPLLKRALVIKEKLFGINHPRYAETLYQLANVYLNLERLNESEALNEQALSIREQTSPDGPEVAESLHALARLNLRKGRWSRAIELSRRSVRTVVGLIEKDPGRVAISSAPPREYLGQGLGILRRASVEGEVGPEAASEAFELAQWANQTAAAAALNQMAVRFGSGMDALAVLIRNQQDAANEISALENSLLTEISKPADQRQRGREDAMRRRIGEIEIHVKQLGARITTDFPRYTDLVNPKPLSPADVQKLIGPKEAVLLFHISDRVNIVWAVTRERVEWRQIKATRSDLDDQIAKLRSTLDIGIAKQDADPFDLKAAHALYSAILGPVGELIAEKPELIIIPSGSLASLPFHVLVTQNPAAEAITDYREAAWFVRRHAVTVLPSVTSLRALREVVGRVSAPLPYIGFGDPVFERAFGVSMSENKTQERGASDNLERLSRALPPLPDTADELRAVARSLGASSTSVKLGKDASERIVKDLKLDEYRIVHFATHALVAAETALFDVDAEPALALSLPQTPSSVDNGLLTSSEVAALKLNADWVILSACNTAAGDKPEGETLSGLARAFFYAGAKTLLVSHWPVQSNAAVSLTTETIQKLDRKNGMSPAEALRLSMLALMQDSTNRRNAHPAVWAPFVIVGTVPLARATP